MRFGIGSMMMVGILRLWRGRKIGWLMLTKFVVESRLKRATVQSTLNQLALVAIPLTFKNL